MRATGLSRGGGCGAKFLSVAIAELSGLMAPWLPWGGDFLMLANYVWGKAVESIVIYCGVNCRSANSSVSPPDDGSEPVVVEIPDVEVPMYKE